MKTHRRFLSRFGHPTQLVAGLDIAGGGDDRTMFTVLRVGHVVLEEAPSSATSSSCTASRRSIPTASSTRPTTSPP